MSNKRWSDWMSWAGGECPVCPTDYVEVKYDCYGDIEEESGEAQAFDWQTTDAKIFMYRYKVTASNGIADEDEEAAIQENYERLNKQPRYMDKGGRDWIDEFAATATVDEFRGAMKFTIGKYLRRAGKKDALQSEIEKIGDYARRWVEYERKLQDAL